MNENQDFRKNFKVLAKKIFIYPKVSIKNLDAREIGILFDNGGFVIEKTKGEDSIKIFLRKKGKEPLWLRTLMIVCGNEFEKEIFYNSYNKFFFETNDDLNGILVFLKNKYDTIIKKYFEDDSIDEEMNRYFCNLPIKILSSQEQHQFSINMMLFARKIRFSKDGTPYLKT